MKIATTTPFLLRPYSVSQVVEDDGTVMQRAPASVRPLGRALLQSAGLGAAVVVATADSPGADKVGGIDYKKLAKGVVAVAGETLTGKAVAQSAWHLSSLSSTTTPDELAKTLMAHHVAPQSAKLFAENALKILNDPISRGILISVSAGAATYVVVQRTSLSTSRKWAIILGVATLVGAVFAVLYRLKLAA